MTEVSKLRQNNSLRTVRLTLPYAVAVALPLVSDFLMICVASLIASLSYDTLTLRKTFDAGTSIGVGILAAGLFCGIGLNLGIYKKPSESYTQKVASIIIANWTIVGLSLSTALFLLKAGTLFSRVDAVIFYFTGILSLFASYYFSRNIVRFMANEGMLACRRAVVIGENQELLHLGSDYLTDIGYEDVRRFSFETTLNPLSNVGAALDKALIYARRSRAQDVLFAVSWQQKEILSHITTLIRSTPLPALLLPDQVTRTLLRSHDVPWSRNSKFSIELKRAPLNRLEQSLKRLCDLVGATLGLIMLLPLFVFVAFLIKIDSKGPVLFLQRRAGFDQRVFRIYKFRSMSVLEDGCAIRQAKRGDARVTRVGAILRRTSMDEIPQLLNVLRGEMSLIGPRPHALAHDWEYKKVVAKYASRHHVKPGITGWAQVHGLRGETADAKSMSDRIAKDLWYIDNWSFWLDLIILVRTCVSLGGKKAY